MALTLDLIRSWYNTIFLMMIQSFARAILYVLQVIMCIYRFISNHVHPFLLQFFYFIIIDLIGSLLLMVLKPTDPDFKPRYVDMLFLSTSAVTVSGLSTVEMERLSSSQIVVTTVLMLVSGDVFVSMLGVFFRTSKPRVGEHTASQVNSVIIELEVIDSISKNDIIESGMDISVNDSVQSCLKYLGLIILVYWVSFHVTGFIACLVYVHINSSSKEVLRRKGINLVLFAIVTTVSCFANCGLVATNENMAIFGKNSGLVYLEALLILAGNKLFPLFLRLAIWALKWFMKNNKDLEFMLKNPKEIKFAHLLTNLHILFRSITMISMIVFMVTLFCLIDSRHPVFEGHNSYQKVVTELFIAIHASLADYSLMSPAVLLFVIFTMYLPSSATFMPLKEDEDKRSHVGEKENSRGIATVVKMLIFPQVVCVIIFVIVACITERRKLLSDPLNFSTLNVIFEVVSAYGNVGLSIRYACSRLLKLHPEMSCEDQPYSFVGWWSDEGKLLIIFVMLYGRLKKFSKGNGKAWKLRG